MDVSGTQPLACKAEVGEAYSGTEQGGSGCPYIRADLLFSGTISTAIRVRDMDPDIAYAEGAGRITP